MCSVCTLYSIYLILSTNLEYQEKAKLQVNKMPWKYLSNHVGMQETHVLRHSHFAAVFHHHFCLKLHCYGLLWETRWLGFGYFTMLSTENINIAWVTCFARDGFCKFHNGFCFEFIAIFEIWCNFQPGILGNFKIITARVFPPKKQWRCWWPLLGPFLNYDSDGDIDWHIT